MSEKYLSLAYTHFLWNSLLTELLDDIYSVLDEMQLSLQKI